MVHPIRCQVFFGSACPFSQIVLHKRLLRWFCVTYHLARQVRFYMPCHQFNSSVKCSMTVCNQFSLLKKDQKFRQTIKGRYVEQFHEISIISRNKWDHHWARVWQLLSRGLRLYFLCATTSDLVVGLLYNTHKKHKTRVRCCANADGAKAVKDYLPVADGGRSERQMENDFQHVYPLQWSQSEKPFDWRSNISSATRSNRVYEEWAFVKETYHHKQYCWCDTYRLSTR